jgi:hypothetical protein
MAIFYSVVEGDPLDSGENSHVIDGLANCTIEGPDARHRRMTFLGHMAWCDRCKSAGEIVAAAGCRDNRRMFDATLGRYQALGGDKVLCKCSSPPRIIPVYGRSWMVIDDTGGVGNATAADSSRESFQEPGSFDEQVWSVATGTTLDGYPYFIETADGRTFNGRTEANGRLPRVVTDSAGEYTVHWGDEALARQAGV